MSWSSDIIGFIEVETKFLSYVLPFVESLKGIQNEARLKFAYIVDHAEYSLFWPLFNWANECGQLAVNC